MNKHEKINYLEVPVKDIKATQAFFQQVFAWQFVDYGPDYCCVSDVGIDVGFYQSPLCATTSTGSVLVVFYSDGLAQTEQKIVAAGGTVVKDTFEFPGGRRFHFSDLNGNEFAVWSDQ